MWYLFVSRTHDSWTLYSFAQTTEITEAWKLLGQNSEKGGQFWTMDRTILKPHRVISSNLYLCKKFYMNRNTYTCIVFSCYNIVPANFYLWTDKTTLNYQRVGSLSLLRYTVQVNSAKLFITSTLKHVPSWYNINFHLWHQNEKSIEISHNEDFRSMQEDVGNIFSEISGIGGPCECYSNVPKSCITRYYQ